MASKFAVEDIDDTILSGGQALIEVKKVTESITDWNYFSLLLGLEQHQYKSIQKKADNPEMEILQTWLDKGKASWASLAGYLHEVGKVKIANDIATNHKKIRKEERPLANVQISFNELSLNHSKQLTSLRLFRLLQDKSCDWDKIGRELGIEQNFRTTLTRNLALTDEARLEYILEKWLESSYPSPTWLDFMKILTDYLKFGDVAQRTQAFVSTIPC